MKYWLECKVEGKIFIKREIRTNYALKEYIMIPDNKGWLSSIRIIKSVDQPEKYSSRMEKNEKHDGWNIYINGVREDYLELVKEFQILESTLSLSMEGALTRIIWDRPNEGFIPENDEEKNRLTVSEFELHKEYIESAIHLDQQGLDVIIKTKHLYDSLAVPQAFFREGMNQFHSRRYINAFYNFYFVLEDFYGKGKTKNQAIADAYKSSPELLGFVDWILKEQIGKDPRHKASIQALCTEEKISYGNEGIIDLLIRIRGNLHHYSRQSSKRVVTPFGQDEFEGIAFLVMGVSLRAILQRVLEINRLHHDELVS
jgi:hypothetical protein